MEETMSELQERLRIEDQTMEYLANYISDLSMREKTILLNEIGKKVQTRRSKIGEMIKSLQMHGVDENARWMVKQFMEGIG